LELANPDLQKVPGVSQEEWERRLDIATLDCAAHANLIRDFAMIAAGAGHPVQVPEYLVHLFARAEPSLTSYMSRFFNGKDVQTDEGLPRLEPIFAIAQHHGVPTGLLDWSRNPLVAAYFAAEHITHNEPDDNENMCVFVLHMSAFKGHKHFSKYLKSYSVPPRIVAFLDAQEGQFSWCPLAYHMFMETGTYPALDDVLPKIDHVERPTLIKVTLPQNKALDVLRILWREHVSLAHLMPTFDHVYRTLLVQSQFYVKDSKSSC
jgi:hypothetical protein